jgi:hypothetical protein
LIIGNAKTRRRVAIFFIIVSPQEMRLFIQNQPDGFYTLYVLKLVQPIYAKTDYAIFAHIG